MSNLSGGPRHARIEPTVTTIADLLALAAGVALAASLEWYSGWAAQLGAMATTPTWYLRLYYLMEGLQKCLVAMTPVVVARRIRYGGPIRPSEFLAFSSSVPRLLMSLERLPTFGYLRAHGRKPGQLPVRQH